MKLVLIPVISSVIIAGIIVYMFILTNPLDNPITVIKYPYAISVKPPLLNTDGSVQISVSIYEGASRGVTLADLTLLLVEPRGEIIPTKLSPTKLLSELTLPQDIPNVKFIPGKYSILLLSKGVNQNVTATFEVLSYPPYISSLFSFLIKDGHALTIGLMISVITAIYQFLAGKNDDRKRILQSQSDWMRDHGAQYNWLYANCSSVCDYFKVKKTDKGYQVALDLKPGQQKRLLYDILDCYRAYIAFYESGIGYNFRDYQSEDFVDLVWFEIRKLYSEILESSPKQLPPDQSKGPDYMKKFFKDAKGKVKYYYDLEKNKEFSTYSSYMMNWLNSAGNDVKFPNIKKLYSYHFVYSNMLFLMIYESVLTSYSRANEVEKQIRTNFKTKYAELNEYIEYLNHQIYDEEREPKPELYFKLKFNNRDLGERKWLDRWKAKFFK